MAERGRPWKQGDTVTIHGVVHADEDQANWMVDVQLCSAETSLAMGVVVSISARALLHHWTGPMPMKKDEAPRTDEVWIPLPMSLQAAGKIMAAMAEEWPDCVVGTGSTERPGHWLLIREAPQ